MPVLLPFILSGQSERSVNAVYELRENIPYVEAEKASDAYRKKRCKLDFYYPKDVKAFPTVVWFHGGGLRAGRKEIPKSLKKKGIGVIAPSYRLFPKAKCPEYIEDAAASVAWAFKNVGRYGGRPRSGFYFRPFRRWIPDQHGRVGQGVSWKAWDWCRQNCRANSVQRSYDHSFHSAGGKVDFKKKWWWSTNLHRSLTFARKPRLS
jgi:hypothetical protein